MTNVIVTSTKTTRMTRVPETAAIIAKFCSSFAPGERDVPPGWGVLELLSKVTTCEAEPIGLSSEVSALDVGDAVVLGESMVRRSEEEEEVAVVVMVADDEIIVVLVTGSSGSVVALQVGTGPPIGAKHSSRYTAAHNNGSTSWVLLCDY